MTVTEDDVIKFIEKKTGNVENVVRLTEGMGYGYFSAFVGLWGFRAIYDYDKMIEYILDEDPTQTISDAEDWIGENTMRGIPYGGPMHPLIMYSMDDMLPQDYMAESDEGDCDKSTYIEGHDDAFMGCIESADCVKLFAYNAKKLPKELLDDDEFMKDKVIIDPFE